MEKLIVVDDNSLLRENIKMRLAAHFEIMFDTGNAKELFRFLNEQNTSTWPAIILMDIEMDEMDGIAATARIKAEYPGIKVAMLTVFEQEEKVWQSILAGADGYILKDETKERLINGIEDILHGGAYMSPSIALKAMHLLKRHTEPFPTENLDLHLTPREFEILELIAQGCSYKQIADKIFISVFTAKTHIHNIYEKLQVNNKTEAAIKMKNISNRIKG